MKNNAAIKVFAVYADQLNKIVPDLGTAILDSLQEFEDRGYALIHRDSVKDLVLQSEAQLVATQAMLQVAGMQGYSVIQVLRY